MSISAIIHGMQAAGADPELILQTVIAIDEERAAKNRARVAKCRANKKNGNVTCITSITQKENPPTPPKEKSPPSDIPLTGDISSTPPKRGPTLCAIDWQPKPTTVEGLIAEGFNRQKIEFGRNEMIDWSRSNGKKKHDWDATLRNWMRRDLKKTGPPDRQSRWQKAIAETRGDLGL